MCLGLGSGEECFCRHNKKYRELGEVASSECDVECAGDSTETCGGHNAVEVFKIQNKNDSAPG